MEQIQKEVEAKITAMKNTTVVAYYKDNNSIATIDDELDLG